MKDFDGGDAYAIAAIFAFATGHWIAGCVLIAIPLIAGML